MKRNLMAGAVAVLAAAAWLGAQGGRPASPPGSSAVEVGGHYDPKAAEPTYLGGKWIEITYGRPILRGRDVFGKPGPDYGKVANPDQPVWRAGANVTTQLKNEVPLIINGKTVAPGTHTMFVDLKPNNWTLIVSNWKAQTRYDPSNKQEIWGAYGYTPDKDVVRAPMKLETTAHAFEQMSWQFVDMTASGGTMALMWERNIATVPFRIGS